MISKQFKSDEWSRQMVLLQTYLLIGPRAYFFTLHMLTSHCLENAAVLNLELHAYCNLALLGSWDPRRRGKFVFSKLVEHFRNLLQNAPSSITFLLIAYVFQLWNVHWNPSPYDCKRMEGDNISVYLNSREIHHLENSENYIKFVIPKEWEKWSNKFIQRIVKPNPSCKSKLLFL